jgi:hypothetical protein
MRWLLLLLSCNVFADTLSLTPIELALLKKASQVSPMEPYDAKKEYFIAPVKEPLPKIRQLPPCQYGRDIFGDCKPKPKAKLKQAKQHANKTTSTKLSNSKNQRTQPRTGNVVR